nr:rRNA pseudouridine synthase [Spirosomataceae bacterium]
PFDRDKKPFEKREDRPYGDKKRDFDRPFDRDKKPFEKREDRAVRPRKRDEDAEASTRRVGRFEEAPRYNLKRAEEQYSKATPREDDGLIRLNKYISNSGICSRREADELIEAGQISVNGKTISEMGYKVAPTDVVKYGNRVLNPEKMVYILVNKPKDYITTTDDPEGRHTVMELIAGACPERVYPVGRLDRNTTGLLLLTNDGELAEKLMHPSNEIQKIYQVELDKPVTEEHFEQIKAGLELEDGPIKPDDLGIVTADAMVVGLEIHSGRNRIVRRIFEHLGYEVLKLDRTVYAGLNKKELPRGKWRFLNEKEVIRLKFLL